MGNEVTTPDSNPKRDNAKVGWCEPIFDALDFSKTWGETDGGISIEQEKEWVQNVLGELMQQASPTLRLRKVEGTAPKVLGRYLGQQCANLYALSTMLRPTPQNIEAAKKAMQMYKSHRHLPDVESKLLAIKWDDDEMKGLKENLLQFKEALHGAFKAALVQPDYLQAVEFFQGFAKGISKPGLSKSGLAGKTTATIIYEKLFTHRREVEKLPSYAELQSFLMRVGVPKNFVGNVRRLQKLCERLGLHLGKRGRPRKSQKMRHNS